MTAAVATETGRRFLDAYFTPQELADALTHRLVDDGFWRGGQVLEPHAGGGAFVRSARWILRPRPISVHANEMDDGRRNELFENVEADCLVGHDFLEFPSTEFSLIIGNPPFSNAEAHVRKALSLRAPFGVVAFLLRLAFLESRDRVDFWREFPASKIYALSQRPTFTGGGTDNSAYGFFVWATFHRGPTELEVISWR